MPKSKNNKKSKSNKSQIDKRSSTLTQLKSGEFYQALIAEPNALNRFYHVMASRLSGGDVLLVHFIFEKSGQLHTYYSDRDDRLAFELEKSDAYFEGIHLKPTTSAIAKKLIMSAIAHAEQGMYVAPRVLDVLINIFHDINENEAGDVEFHFE